MAYRTKIVLWGICALLLTSCAAGSTWSADTTTAVVTGAGAALLAFAQSLLEAGVLSEEQFTKLAAKAGAVQTAIDVSNAAMQAIGQAMSALRAETVAVKAVAEAAWSSEEVLTASGAASAVTAWGVNHLRNRAREVRGEPVGKQNSSTHAAPPSGV